MSPTPITSAFGARQKLGTLFSKQDPEVVRFLFDTWNAQSKNLPIEAIISNQQLTPAVMRKWQNEYVSYINKMESVWTASNASNGQYQFNNLFKSAYMREPLEYSTENIFLRSWMREHSGELLTNMTTKQIQANNFLIRYFTTELPLTVDEMGRVLRGTVGVTNPNAIQLKNLSEKLRKDGLSKNAISKAVRKKSAKMIARRSVDIARNEIITAYNQAYQHSYLDAYNQGLLPPGTQPMKTWNDGGHCVCAECCSLNGETVPINSNFSSGSSFPPDPHPN